MSIETSVTVTATGSDAFKLLTLINEAGLGDSVSVNQEQAPLEGGSPPKVEEVRKAKKYVVNGKKTYFTKSMQNRVRKAAAEGLTVPKIAEKFGLPYQSLRDWMINNGVEFKKDSRGRKPSRFTF